MKAPLKPNSEKNADDLTIEQIERIIANHKSGVQIASVHLYRQLLAAMREVTMLREMNERNVEQAWKSMEDTGEDVCGVMMEACVGWARREEE